MQDRMGGYTKGKKGTWKPGGVHVDRGGATISPPNSPSESLPLDGVSTIDLSRSK